MKIDDYLVNKKNVCITGHIRPDGDCVGSALALYTYIKGTYPGIVVDVFLENPSDKLSFICNFDKINSRYDSRDPYEIVICLDCADADRMGKAGKYFKKAEYTLNIDHHISNTYFAAENIVFPKASSSCEVLYGLLDDSKINRDIAISLYTGILYDTGVFKYTCTSSKTMEIVAKLMKFDIPTDYIVDSSFYAKTYDENRIFGYSILNSKLAYDGKVIYSCVDKNTLNEFGVSGKELEGIVAQLRLTKGVECAFFVYELPDGNSKVSLRSQAYADVNVIAAAFGGGGHVRASGCIINKPLDEACRLMLQEIGKYIIYPKA